MKVQDVALVGYMRSGKDSVASCLQHIYPSVRPVSFATALKYEAAKALNAARTDGDPYYTPDFFNKDENRPRFRPFLQWYGTDYRREQNPEHWVEQVKEVLDASVDERRSWACTDARFINELNLLKGKGFAIIELAMNVDELSMYLRSKGMKLEEINKQLAHPSEREWQSFPKDIALKSQFGNLPRLTQQVIAVLTGAAPTLEVAAKIDAFYAEKYPDTYGKKG